MNDFIAVQKRGDKWHVWTDRIENHFPIPSGEHHFVLSTQEEALAQPVELPVTRLKVTLLDEMNDQFIKLENCIVQVLGELNIVEDTFNYSNTFAEGDRYEIIIHVKLK